MGLVVNDDRVIVLVSDDGGPDTALLSGEVTKSSASTKTRNTYRMK